MASEIGYQHVRTGATLYAIILDLLGRAWNGAAFEVRAVANWGNYDIALTESEAGSYWYTGAFPAAIADGTYTVMVFARAGAAPAATDELLGTGRIQWKDAAEVAPATPGDEMDVAKIGGYTEAATALLAMLDGTGAVLTLSQLRIDASGAGGAIDVDNDAGPGVSILASTYGAWIEGASGDGLRLVGGGGGPGLAAYGQGIGPGIRADGGASADGIKATGGSDAGYGMRLVAQSGTLPGLAVFGAGAGSPLHSTLVDQITADVATSGDVDAAEAAIRGGTRTLEDLATPSAVWEAVTSGHGTAGTFGKAVADILAKTGLITERSIQVVSPVASDGTITITRGDDYAEADGTEIRIDLAEYAGPTIVGATAVAFGIGPLRAGRPREVDGVATAEIMATTLRLTAQLTAAQTLSLAVGLHRWDFQITLASGAKYTPATGVLVVAPDVTP